MTYGFLGAGNMAGAIIRSALKAKTAQPADIYIYDKSDDISDALSLSAGVIKTYSYKELTEKSDILFIAVKPQVGRELLPEISALIQARNPIIVSMMAGISIEKIESWLGFKPRLIRMMPNINAEICEGVTAVTTCSVLPDDLRAVCDMLSASGMITTLEERYFPVFTALASSSPAFTCLYIDSLSRAAVRMGLDKSTALSIAAQAVIGTAKMLLETDIPPHTLVDRICSPGGMTIEGVCELSDLGFESAIVRAVNACVAKDKVLLEKQS